MPTPTAEAYIIPINRKGDDAAEILIYDEIGESTFSDGITAKQFAKDLAELGNVSVLHVRINSLGGSIVQGLAIANTLKRHPANKVVHIDGFALSMAAGIAMEGDTILMAKNSLMMIHNPHNVAVGDADDMRKEAEVLDKTKQALIQAYTAKTGLSEDVISQMMTDETWMTAEEAVANGFADEIDETLEAVVNFPIPNNVRVPGRYMNDFSNLFTPKAIGETMSDKTGTTAPEEPQNAEPKAATIAELKAMEGIDIAGPQFIVDQLDNESTLQQAESALRTILLNSLSEEKKERKKAEELAAQNKSSHGVDPLDTANPKSGVESSDTSDDKTPQYADATEIRNVISAELLGMKNDKRFQRMGNFSVTSAMNHLRKAKPELFETELQPTATE